jgi:hypothetical protein
MDGSTAVPEEEVNRIEQEEKRTDDARRSLQALSIAVPTIDSGKRFIESSNGVQNTVNDGIQLIVPSMQAKSTAATFTSGSSNGKPQSSNAATSNPDVDALLSVPNLFVSGSAGDLPMELPYTLDETKLEELLLLSTPPMEIHTTTAQGLTKSARNRRLFRAASK